MHPLYHAVSCAHVSAHDAEVEDGPHAYLSPRTAMVVATTLLWYVSVRCVAGARPTVPTGDSAVSVRLCSRGALYWCHPVRARLAHRSECAAGEDHARSSGGGKRSVPDRRPYSSLTARTPFLPSEHPCAPGVTGVVRIVQAACIHRRCRRTREQ